jgi:hypothetical protein
MQRKFELGPNGNPVVFWMLPRPSHVEKFDIDQDEVNPCI